MPPEVFHTPFPNGTADNTAERSLAAIAYLFAADPDSQSIAAVIAERVQGGCRAMAGSYRADRISRSLARASCR